MEIILTLINKRKELIAEREICEKHIEKAEEMLAGHCANIRCEDCLRKGYEPHSTRVCEFFAAKSDRLYELYAGEVNNVNL